MSASLHITNARIVTADAVVEGGLVVDGGRIQEILPAARMAPGAIDLDGDYLLPGLVELHTDNLERQFQPRPRVRWPAQAAMLAHDRQIAAAGITTVCDGVCVGIYGGKRERIEFLQTSLEALHEAQRNRSLTAEHFLHLRCEVSDPHVVEMFEPLLEEPSPQAGLVHGSHPGPAPVARHRQIPDLPPRPHGGIRGGVPGADRAPHRGAENLCRPAPAEAAGAGARPADHAREP